MVIEIQTMPFEQKGEGGRGKDERHIPWDARFLTRL